MTSNTNEIRPFKVGDKVYKVSGYKYTGVVVSVFNKLNGVTRIVVEHTGTITGECETMLHLFREDQFSHRDES